MKVKLSDIGLGEPFEYTGKCYVLMGLTNRENSASLAYDRTYSVIAYPILESLSDVSNLNVEYLNSKCKSIPVIGTEMILVDRVTDKPPFEIKIVRQYEIRRKEEVKNTEWV